MAHELQERYSKLIAAKLRASLVTKTNVIFNDYYEGEPKAGAVKIPVRDANPTVNNYNKTNVASNALTYGSTQYITAVIDNDKFVNEYIDGYEAAAVPDGIVADRLDSAGYALALAEDVTGIATLVNAAQGLDKAGTAFASTDPRYGKAGSVDAVTLSATNAYDTLVDLGVYHDTVNVPREGRYALVSPAAYGFLLKDDNFIRQGDLSQRLKESGALGMIAGYAIYQSNNLGKIGANAVQIVAGHPRFATRVDEWMIQPHLQDLDGDANVVGGSAVKGRWIFTHEVTSPEAIAVIHA